MTLKRFSILLILCSFASAIAESADSRSAADGEAAATGNDHKGSDFWSFRQIQRPEPPSAGPSSAGPSLAPLDRFVLHQLQQRDLWFAPEADRLTLCRRLFLDLTGVPPTPGQSADFLSDQSADAVEHLVDRLLASPQYGERWGRQWLDVAGYADSNGYIRHDSLRPLAWRYRDYVIDSLNADKPYDQFWIEQLAGDELVDYQNAEHLTADEIQMLAATHFMRNAPDGTDNTEGNETTRTIERYAVLESLLETTMSAMFGMTIECARCHDHKFDPIPQRDYYALQAIFYPAFNVREWVQPKNRWIYAAGKADVAAWRASGEKSDAEIAVLRSAHRDWIAAHRPSGQAEWRDAFDKESLGSNWTASVSGDQYAAPATLTALDSTSAPAAQSAAGRLKIFAAPGGDSRWLATQQVFDWTPEKTGHWIQVSFDLVESHGADGQPAERIGYYIAMHDHDDNSEVKGGNILLDGNPGGGASVVVDYPGRDQTGLGSIGKTGYVAGHRFGVRVTRTAENEYLLQHLVDDQAEPGTLTLTNEQLPNGAFGFELCCSRNFTVDNVLVESSVQGTPQTAESDEQLAYAAELEQRVRQLDTAIAAVNAKRLPEPGTIAWATDLSEKSPETRVLKRGDYFQPGDVVEPGPLAVLEDSESRMRIEPPASGSKTTGRRLAFARWATHPDSRAAALLARVQVDRIWRGHFGQGLVPTPENFGSSGVAPSHPELLEWLASELIASGWKQKTIHRMIVLSKTWRQTSVAPDAAVQQDPQNTLYSRFPAHRLEAEQVRDSMLAAAGVLNLQGGGPAIETVDQGDRQIVLPEPVGPGPHAVDRRSIYIRYRRSQPLTFLKTFDQASPDPNCVSRQASTVVAQSLAMLNGGFARRMGLEFATRVSAQAAEGSLEEAVRYAFQVALVRDPAPEELTRCCEFLEQQIQRYQVEAADKAKLLALADFCRMLLASNEFLYLQ
jgi:hypothetical protein